MTKTTQNLNDIESLSFDKDDQQLFYIDDLRLKADALRHSVLPKLQLMTNHAISKIDEIYGVDVFEDSHITKSPNFRTKRKGKLKTNYNYSLCGLEGKRVKNKWLGLKRKDNKEAQIVPFKFVFELDQNGLRASMWTQLLQLTDETYIKYLNLLERSSDIIGNFCFYSNFKFNLPSMIHSTKENIDWMKENKKYYHDFTTPYLNFPISLDSIRLLIEDYSIFYYLYDSYIGTAKGEELDQVLWNKLHDWSNSVKHKEKRDTPIVDLDKVKQAAAKKVRVMPSLRWQVFQRDGWKCVSCGKSSHDNVILHMDHIKPRSLGGSDSIKNLQTLCWECNIGKSNKDDTDLRN